MSVCNLITLRIWRCMKLKFSKCIARDLTMCSVVGKVVWINGS